MSSSGLPTVDEALAARRPVLDGLERLVVAMAANPEMVHLFLIAASDHHELGELMELLVKASIQSDEAFDEELSEDFYAELEDAE